MSQCVAYAMSSSKEAPIQMVVGVLWTMRNPAMPPHGNTSTNVENAVLLLQLTNTTATQRRQYAYRFYKSM